MSTDCREEYGTDGHPNIVQFYTGFVLFLILSKNNFLQKNFSIKINNENPLALFLAKELIKKNLFWKNVYESKC